MAKVKAIKVIKKALKEVGYEEKASAKNLYSKHKNAGNKNYTKYGKWYGANGVYWCAEFVSWVFAKAGASDLCCKSASCELMRQWFMRKGLYNTHSPKRGDVIFFLIPPRGGANHVGIVYKVKGDTVYTVEGNTSPVGEIVDNGGEVCKKNYSISNTRILGYGTPDYKAPDEKSQPVPQPTLKYGMSGTAVRNLQICLNRVLSVSLKTDGDYGEDTQSKVKSFQASVGLKNDGIYGKSTYKKMKKAFKQG